MHLNPKTFTTDASFGINLVNCVSPNTAWPKVLLLTCSLLQPQKYLTAKPSRTGQKQQVWKTISQKTKEKMGLRLGPGSKVQEAEEKKGQSSHKALNP